MWKNINCDNVEFIKLIKKWLRNRKTILLLGSGDDIGYLYSLCALYDICCIQLEKYFQIHYLEIIACECVCITTEVEM